MQVRIKYCTAVLAIILLVVGVCFLQSEPVPASPSYLENGPPPKLPTIFEFLRTDTELPRSERKKIIARASEYLFRGPPPDFMENYVILDEGKFWYVYFGARGNGILAVEGGHFPIFEGTDSIYLDKETLVAVARNDGFIRDWAERIPSLGFEGETNSAVSGAAINPSETQ